MIVKCECQFCQQPLEFEVEHAGSFVPCPNCGKQTRLLIPGGHIKSGFPVTAAPAALKRKWGMSQWFTLAAIIVLLGLLSYALINPTARKEFVTGPLIWALVVGGIVLFVTLAYLLIVSGIVLQFIIWALIILGLYLCGDGFFLTNTISQSKDGTIFQQAYAMIELVGGALVFCGAMILKLVLKLTAAKPVPAQ